MPKDLAKYFRPEFRTTPQTPLCAGCGHGTVIGLILRAVDELKIDPKDILFVTGIGCCIWIPMPQFAMDSLQTLHGRALAFATGAKLYNPKLKVIAFLGDGDLLDIGGNHLIHAARRNMDFTVILGNNMVYGLTGGQVASTTPKEALTSTTPRGNPYRPFDACKLVEAAGAMYVARYSILQPFQIIKSIKKGLQTPGFAFIETVSMCPTQFGRRNRLDTPVEMLKFLKEKCITKKQAESLSPEELKGKIITGEFKDVGN
jgi:2-oxoglutarate ferredoxin oxidoreductase subunit beta